MFDTSEGAKDKKKYTITVEMEERELISLMNLDRHNSCIYNADLNRYEMGVAALVSKVVRGKCEGYEQFVKDWEQFEAECANIKERREQHA